MNRFGWDGMHLSMRQPGILRSLLNPMILFLVLLPGHGFPIDEPLNADLAGIVREYTVREEWQVENGPIQLFDANWPKIDENLFEAITDYQIEEGIYCELSAIQGNRHLQVSIYRSTSQIMAFGFYSVEKSPSFKFEDIGFEAFLSDQRMIVWYGRFILVVEMTKAVEKYEKILRKAADDMVRLLPRQKQHTPLLNALPDKNRVDHSQKFYARHWLDQSYFRNIVYADYKTSEGYSRIFIIDNRSTAVADSNFWQYYGFMKANSLLLETELKVDTDFFVVEDPLWGRTILAKKNQIIYGVLDFRDRNWTEDRLSDLLNNLKKKKIVKSG